MKYLKMRKAMVNNSKLVFVVYPRTNKLTKGELIAQVGEVGIMAMMSIGGTISTSSVLGFQLKDEAGQKGLPRNWFSGDSRGVVQSLRAMKPDNYHTIHEWCKTKGIPVFSGEHKGEPSLMGIGPYWAKEIDELLKMAVPIESELRPYSTEDTQNEED